MFKILMMNALNGLYFPGYIQSKEMPVDYLIASGTKRNCILRASLFQ